MAKVVVTYRKDTRREQIRRRKLQRHEAVAQAGARFAASFYAIASGEAFAKLETRDAALHRQILARRVARTVAGFMLLVSGLALALVAVITPDLLLPVLYGAWIAGAATYAAARAIAVARAASHEEPGANTRQHAPRPLAHRLERPSLIIPCAGLMVTVILPVSWLAYGMGLGAAPTLLAVLFSAYGMVAAIRHAVRYERAKLSPAPHEPTQPSALE